MSCGADELRGSRARGRIDRHQAQEDLCAHANADTAQENKKEVDSGDVTDTEADRNGREVAHAETDGDPGKIPIAEKEKSLREPDSFGDALSESLCFAQKEKVVAESFTGIFSDGLE